MCDNDKIPCGKICIKILFIFLILVQIIFIYIFYHYVQQHGGIENTVNEMVINFKRDIHCKE